MNTIATNTGMNIEDYEDQSAKRSKLAKSIGITAAGAVGGAAIAAGTAYAAQPGEDDILDGPLTVDEMADGAQVGDEFQPEPEVTPEPTTQYVYVEKPAPEPEPEPEITWDETTNYYVDGEKVMTVEEGTIDDHKFMLVDADADGHADLLAIDVNKNGTYENDEIIEYTPADHVHMGHATAHTTEEHYNAVDPWTNPHPEPDTYAYNPGGNSIHNNFEDEKTGEEYHGDFAENNPDYNPSANMDYSEGNTQYLAENYDYDDNGTYQAGLNEDNMDESTVAPQYDMADADSMDEDYDTMMESEEFLG